MMYSCCYWQCGLWRQVDLRFFHETKVLVSAIFGLAILNVRICCSSLLFVILNEESSCFGLLVRQQKRSLSPGKWMSAELHYRRKN